MIRVATGDGLRDGGMKMFPASDTLFSKCDPRARHGDILTQRRRDLARRRCNLPAPTARKSKAQGEVLGWAIKSGEPQRGGTGCRAFSAGRSTCENPRLRLGLSTFAPLVLHLAREKSSQQNKILKESSADGAAVVRRTWTSEISALSASRRLGVKIKSSKRKSSSAPAMPIR